MSTPEERAWLPGDPPIDFAAQLARGIALRKQVVVAPEFEWVARKMVDLCMTYGVEPVDLIEWARTKPSVERNCSTFPRCECGKANAFWHEEMWQLIDGAPIEEVRWAVTAIGKMLACIAKNAPNPALRFAAREEWLKVELIRRRERIDA